MINFFWRALAWLATNSNPYPFPIETEEDAGIAMTAQAWAAY